MTLKSTWSITSDDENSRQSFLSDWDLEFDLSPSPRYSTEKRSIPALNKLSLNHTEPPLTRSRVKAGEKLMINTPLAPKERHRSTIQHSVDPITGLASPFTSSILFPKQELLKDRVLTSPTDGVNKLADCLGSCSLDENKFNKNYLWPSDERNSHCIRPRISSSPNNTFNSNSFSMSPTTPLFFQATSTTALFGEQSAHLWSRFRFTASTIRDNLWTEQLYSTPLNRFNSPIDNNTSHFSDQPSMLSPSNFFFSSSSPPQTVPSLLTKTPSPSAAWEQQHPVTKSKVPTTKEDLMIKQSSSELFFTLILFILGLVLGYLLTNTVPPDHIRHWFFAIKKTSIEISSNYLHLLSDTLQVFMKYFSSNI